MLLMTNVHKTYQTELIETHALRDLNVSVTKGEFVAVTGSSGSGKTTFLNLAGLLETFEQGSYVLDGEDVSRLDDNARSLCRNQKIGFIFQGFNLIADLNVFENIDVPLRYRKLSSSDRRERVERALETVGLASRLKHLPAQLSGGQQQRVAIARALAGEPALLLADEPTGNLDSIMAHQVMDLLDQIHADGATIVMVTHDRELANRAGRKIELLDGRVVADEPVRLQGSHRAAFKGAERLSVNA